MISSIRKQESQATEKRHEPSKVRSSDELKVLMAASDLVTVSSWHDQDCLSFIKFAFVPLSLGCTYCKMLYCTLSFFPVMKEIDARKSNRTSLMGTDRYLSVLVSHNCMIHNLKFLFLLIINNWFFPRNPRLNRWDLHWSRTGSCWRREKRRETGTEMRRGCWGEGRPGERMVSRGRCFCSQKRMWKKNKEGEKTRKHHREEEFDPISSATIVDRRSEKKKTKNKKPAGVFRDDFEVACLRSSVFLFGRRWDCRERKTRQAHGQKEKKKKKKKGNENGEISSHEQASELGLLLLQGDCLLHQTHIQEDLPSLEG